MARINDYTRTTTPADNDVLIIDSASDSGAGTRTVTFGDLANAVAKRITVPKPDVDPLDSWPVGSIMVRYDNTSPASLIGGSWSQVAKGQALVGQGGGSFTVTGRSIGAETFTFNFSDNMRAMVDHQGSGKIFYKQGPTVQRWTASGPMTGIAINWNESTTSQNGVGVIFKEAYAKGGPPLSTIQPSLCVAIWRRIS